MNYTKKIDNYININTDFTAKSMECKYFQKPYIDAVKTWSTAF